MHDMTTPLRPERDDARLTAGEFGGGETEVPLLLRYFRIAVRRKWVIGSAVAAAFLLGLLITLLMTPLYTATATIEISRESNRVVEIKGVEADNNVGDLEFYQTQYGLLKSRSLAESVARDLRLDQNTQFFEMFGKSRSSIFAGKTNTANDRKDRLRDATDILLDNVSVTPVRLSRLVAISFTSGEPQLSAQIANAWTAHFIQTNLERRFEATSYARKFLETRLEQLRQRLEQSERLLVGYAASQKIINLPSATQTDGSTPPERSIVADDLSTLNSALGNATADMIRARSRLDSAGAGTAAEALGNTAINGLREKRAELAGDYAKLLVQFEPEYPAARAIASQIAQLDKAIAREEGRVRSSLSDDYRASVARQEGLQTRVDGLKSGLLDLRRRSIQYNIYQREVDTNRQLYDGLLQRYKEIGIAGGVGTNNIAIVDAAQIPEKPSRPRMIVNLLLALALGLALGIAAAFALEQIDEAISNPEEVERKLRLPLLGTVPLAEGNAPMTDLADRKSAMVEAYLSVQTSLEFATSHGAPRSLSVTSTRPSEGKSTTAFAIASAFARARSRVVLVDADMRSPSVHNLLGFANDHGTSNYLAGSDDLASMIKPSELPSLSIMTAGPQPPNAAELLTGERFQQMIAKLLENFDHVVVDSPPVMGLADAPLIASRVEGVIFAVESHGIRSSMVRVALGRLAAANANILGVVLTKFQQQRAHYGYGYDYGYSYGSAKAAGDA